MSAVLTSPAQVVNYALRKAGYRNQVGSLYDGTDQSKATLDLYGQMRDAMLATGEWDFAQRTSVGALLKQAPIIRPCTSSILGRQPIRLSRGHTNTPIPRMRCKSGR